MHAIALLDLTTPRPTLRGIGRTAAAARADAAALRTPRTTLRHCRPVLATAALYAAALATPAGLPQVTITHDGRADLAQPVQH